MISQWCQEVPTTSSLPIPTSPSTESRPPLRVSNTNNSQRPQPSHLPARKRAFSALTEVQGHLLIRAGAGAVTRRARDENMKPPAKKKCLPRSTGNLRESGSGMKRVSTNHPKTRLAEKHRLRHSPRH